MDEFVEALTAALELPSAVDTDTTADWVRIFEQAAPWPLHAPRRPPPS